jgi:hypothetical protein
MSLPGARSPPTASNPGLESSFSAAAKQRSLRCWASIIGFVEHLPRFLRRVDILSMTLAVSRLPSIVFSASDGRIFSRGQDGRQFYSSYETLLLLSDNMGTPCKTPRYRLVSRPRTGPLGVLIYLVCCAYSTAAPALPDFHRRSLFAVVNACLCLFAAGIIVGQLLRCPRRDGAASDA